MVLYWAAISVAFPSFAFLLVSCVQYLYVCNNSCSTVFHSVVFGWCTMLYILLLFRELSQGIVNFWLFCLFTREVRNSTPSTLWHLCKQKHYTVDIEMPESVTWPWITTHTVTDSTTGYGITSSLESNKILMRIICLHHIYWNFEYLNEYIGLL